MAIDYFVEHKRYVPVGLSELNPVTCIAKKAPEDTETFAEMVIKDANDVTVATLRSTFYEDANGNFLAEFEISEILKGLLKPREILGPLRQQIVQQSVVQDSTKRIAKFTTNITGAGPTTLGYAVYAGTNDYNLFYTVAPDNIPNLQSEFFDYVIVADDFPDTPYYFGVDFNETDFDFDDFN